MDDETREAAKRRIHKKRHFWGLVLSFSALTILMNVIWLVSGAPDGYWPLWPTIGFLIALFFVGSSTFGPRNRPITEEEIDREARRLSGGR
ncbi:2TM domain-containing protein [Leucobacter luti]|uniref:2TM domain-containing protein n=1 Tax=Leucobacter luti TaxID=340320 RepID=UPI003CFEE1B6